MKQHGMGFLSLSLYLLLCNDTRPIRGRPVLSSPGYNEQNFILEDSFPKFKKSPSYIHLGTHLIKSYCPAYLYKGVLVTNIVISHVAMEVSTTEISPFAMFPRCSSPFYFMFC